MELKILCYVCNKRWGLKGRLGLSLEEQTRVELHPHHEAIKLRERTLLVTCLCPQFPGELRTKWRRSFVSSRRLPMHCPVPEGANYERRTRYYLTERCQLSPEDGVLCLALTGHLVKCIFLEKDTNIATAKDTGPWWDYDPHSWELRSGKREPDDLGTIW